LSVDHLLVDHLLVDHLLVDHLLVDHLLVDTLLSDENSCLKTKCEHIDKLLVNKFLLYRLQTYHYLGRPNGCRQFFRRRFDMAPTLRSPLFFQRVSRVIDVVRSDNLEAGLPDFSR
jgi:hypothetical protein